MTRNQVSLAEENRSPSINRIAGKFNETPIVPSDFSRKVNLILLKEHAKTNVRSDVSANIAPLHARVPTNLKARFYYSRWSLIFK